MRFLPLPNSLNPRKSPESRDRYIRWVLPLWMLSGLSHSSTFYGFNVWIMPLSLMFFGDGAVYSMRTGQVLFALSLPTLTSSVAITYLGPRLDKIGARMCFLIGLLLYIPALALGGLSATKGSIAGFWISIGILSGIGVGFMYYPIAICSVRWYREWGRPALGSGLTGFFAGLWAAIFSFYCPLIIKNHGIHNSFYYNALIITCASIPALLFLTDPSDVPLLEKGADGGTNAGEDHDDTIISADGPDKAVVRSGTKGTGSDEIAAEKPREEESVWDERDGKKVDPENQELRSAPDIPMTIREILEKPQFYLQFLAIFFALLPGFAVKFNISVFASALFHADDQTQSLVSFIYLFSYALSRLSVGLGVGTVFSAYHVSVFAAGLQVPAFIGAALVVILGAKYIWLYVVFQTLVGIGLAAYKVTVGLNVLGRWSLPNLPTVTSLLLWAFAFAGTIGPIIGWSTLTIQGDVPIQSDRTDEILGQSQKAETEEILGVFFFVMAGIALLGGITNAFFVRVVVKNNENV